MRVLVAGEVRLSTDGSGATYAASTFGHDFWVRYLTVFDEVTVLARVAPRADVRGMLRVDGPGVRVHALPHYVGPEQYLRTRRSFDGAVASALREHSGAVLLRCPGNVARVAMQHLGGSMPFGVEVVGDPMDVLARGVLAHPLRPLFRAMAVRDLRRACERAATVAYVSRYTLPQRYPAASSHTFAYSSVSLPPEAFARHSRVFAGGPLRRLVSVGSMDQLYKGFDLLVDVVARLRATHPDLTLTLVGDGRYRPQLQAQVAGLGLEGAVTFTGNLADPAAVRHQLDAADLYVSASRTEGLPRVVIEAMARGLPCVGTDVGATAELLPDRARCTSDDVQALSDTVERHLDPVGATAIARELWQASRRYATEVTQRERNAMFTTLAQVSERAART